MANCSKFYDQDFWSSDDSEDDDYNYLKALDNLNWKTNVQNSSSSSNAINGQTRRRNVAKNGSKPASRIVPKVSTKPAVAVKSRANRNELFIKDLIASSRDKTKDNQKNDNNNEMNKKRDYDLMTEDEDMTDIVIPNVPKNEEKSDNDLIPKKKTKIDVKDSEYKIEDILDKKKANHEKCVTNNNNNKLKTDLNRVKNNRVFGKAFSPTVYSPEVPVMRALPAPQISNPSIISKALTFSGETDPSNSKYNTNLILSIILDWNTKWLNECNESEVPNLLSPFGEGIGLKTCYDSLEEYQSAYIPLILFETWAQIYKDFHSEKSDGFEAIRGPDVTSDDYFMTLMFQTVVTKNKVREYPTDGCLLMLEVTISYGADNEQRKLILFAYVQDFYCEKITTSTTLLPGLAAIPSHSNPQLLKYVVVLTKKPIRFSQKDSKIRFRSVHYLKPTMRQIELISNLNSSPLFKDILKPRAFTCQLVVPQNMDLTSKNFNESQQRAIIGSSEALSRPYPIPKLLFIQGPPGTGKTHTLIGIIKHIYLKWDDTNRLPRILICAPSNGAVDEISRRLYSERQFLTKHRIERHRRALRCVRVGKESQIHPDARKILFEVLIKENSEHEIKRFKVSKEKKIQELDQRMLKLDQEFANLRASGQKNELAKVEKEMKDLTFEMQRVSASTSQPEVDKSSKSRLKLEIMNKADIVLSTLNSSHSAPIENLYRNYGPVTFDCVIVDEASQCSEPELLMPLAYKMTKMILIGDPMQLPATIISKKASSLQLGRSLFERFFHYFRQCEQIDPKSESPVLMLTEQYRMHPQICHFPSTHFYDGKLSSSAKVMKSREFKLKPYIVFDVTDSIENKSDPSKRFNELEANFVVRLVTLIDKMVDTKADNSHKFSVGIITPYNGQKFHLNNKFLDKTFKNISVEINTVDGFQGQERDIIILSAVRAFDQNNGPNKWQSIGFLDSVQRMNVALTRAKYSMILCISGRSLETNKDWKSLIEDSIRRANTRFKVPSTVGQGALKKMLAPIETISIVD